MILDSFKLDGKIALVTGAGRGLGKSMAVGLAEAGADIAGLYNKREGDTGKIITALGRKYLPIQADLSDPSVCDGVIQKVIAKLGRIDILVNNAGTIRRFDALDLPSEAWDVVLNVNLKSVFMLCQSAARFMKDNGGGKIVNIASMMSFQGGINISPYTASKHGVMGITKVLANELAQYNINVNGIAPGYMTTEMNQVLQDDAVRSEQITTRIPAGRWGSGDDLKGAVVFLSSAASDYVQGYTLAVDGGWLAR